MFRDSNTASDGYKVVLNYVTASVYFHLKKYTDYWIYYHALTIIEEKILSPPFFFVFSLIPFSVLSAESISWFPVTAVRGTQRVLTSLISCDADCSKLSWCGAQLRHPVNCINLKGVVRVCQEVCHCHCGVGESKLSGEEANVGAAGLTLLHIPPTLFT